MAHGGSKRPGSASARLVRVCSAVLRPGQAGVVILVRASASSRDGGGARLAVRCTLDLRALCVAQARSRGTALRVCGGADSRARGLRDLRAGGVLAFLRVDGAGRFRVGALRQRPASLASGFVRLRPRRGHRVWDFNMARLVGTTACGHRRSWPYAKVTLREADGKLAASETLLPHPETARLRAEIILRRGGAPAKAMGHLTRAIALDPYRASSRAMLNAIRISTAAFVPGLKGPALDVTRFSLSLAGAA